MIKIENTEVMGWEHAIRGMRNPKNSWDRMDSHFNVSCEDMDCDNCPTRGNDSCVEDLVELGCILGPNDHKLTMQLASGGPVHAKYRRMITVYMDVTAPLYWWKEFDTYKVGTVANSCSTMHKIHAKEFTLDDFSVEHLDILDGMDYRISINDTINFLNTARTKFLETRDKKYWWQMIQLLPSSYNQKRTIMLNYEVLHNIYISRKDHKLDEWKIVTRWIETLPYSELITGKIDSKNNKSWRME